MTNLRSLLFQIVSSPFQVGHISNFILFPTLSMLPNSLVYVLLSIFLVVICRVFFVFITQSPLRFISAAIFKQKLFLLQKYLTEFWKSSMPCVCSRRYSIFLTKLRWQVSRRRKYYCFQINSIFWNYLTNSYSSSSTWLLIVVMRFSSSSMSTLPFSSCRAMALQSALPSVDLYILWIGLFWARITQHSESTASSMGSTIFSQWSQWQLRFMPSFMHCEHRIGLLLHRISVHRWVTNYFLCLQQKMGLLWVSKGSSIAASIFFVFILNFYDRHFK